ncbi:hypothetical protein Q4497_02145 [Mesomycoplasma ovipneumoniae]|uniref:Uncharacterized protein n=1 Tax=Mesomycoplasma ovipneumoniae TaxID=29562 RepID=A0AAW6Q5P9_9BACT|nr:hypothetical protein [Mesomycoplasma ovipneumoniae]MDF9628021.1 hypothetical protein [Mesomycoplasma ovipneumoniae]MDO4158092.1 hypothetical protein [Mesomycoplasma ovipneumoniae]MDO4158180.1 hypothetical protein [Mesomycoplasma ovipneumoniae]MDO6821817.1 hypothetical protein [Mesomycoplasma ovipneumoniae]MDO6855657.1 hypothetical protein [Mesomycoplasma ovipneumoniae]
MKILTLLELREIRKSRKISYYRIYIKKYKSATFDNSVEDKLALPYLVNNEK